MADTTKTQVDRKARLKIPPQPVPKQDPKERIKNWQEVYLGYDLPTARIEATRCIQCPAAPCQKACPLHNDIPGALLKLEEGDVMAAAEVFRATNPAPDMCGRLCPQEQLCEGDCVVGKVAIPVAIGKLEAFIADQQQAAGRPLPALPPPTGKRVAVVGSGPAGLAVAEQLALRGHGVKVFEAWPRPGGVLRYGIPNFKMDKRHVDDQVHYLHRLGIQFVFNVHVGYDVTVDALLAEGFDSVFLGQGAGQGNRLNVPGEELEGIHMATEFLVRLNLPPEELPDHLREPLAIGKRVVVVGGGDTAMDCVRSAVRTGAEVVCAYRRTEAEMGGREEERRHAHEEGVRFHYLTAPIRFVADGGRVQAVRFQRMELGEPDESGRPKPVPVIGSEFEESADTVVIAIGYKVEKLLFQTTPGLEASEWGTVAADEGGQTSREGIFAAGDSVRGADLVVTALADAKRAAEAIDRYLREETAAA
ncbi:MAG TPA: NADPH-dependent glutamate synthase [Dehalococcoidia bacterium]|nr:NADPH-dependent glutamate synthase [Dehalococcoidia bacterium]